MRKIFLNNILFIFVFCLFLIRFTGCSENKDTIGIYSEILHPQVEFATSEIQNSLRMQNFDFNDADSENADIHYILDISDTTLRAEGFSIKIANGKIQISAIDPAGLMYGGQELAEQIRCYGWKGIRETSQNPYMKRRGSKFNIPLDVRTPSYSDLSDAAQKNMSEMWDFSFWKEYIDNMARYRYNFISIWNLHPFPSMVKVPGYDDIALNNVEQSTGPFNEYYRNIGVGFDSPEIINNRIIIKKITIEDKIEFWKKVMAYGKNRNIDFYIMTWNIFTYGTEGKYGITDKADNSVTRDYFRKSINQMYLTYPDLAGIGLTTGENMHYTLEEKEEWVYDTYGSATLDLAKAHPERHFTLIHRCFGQTPPYIASVFKPVIDQKNIDFLFSWKYAKAHVYSATRQPYHEEEHYVENLHDNKTLWTLRNDDIYFFRWGDPDFVREFIKNIPHRVSAGYYYGSDQWIWGREFTTRNAGTPRQLEIDKHWFQWMLWGRLGYFPEITNERFTSLIQERFPEADPAQLFSAWQAASKVYPITTSFHWGRMDYKWYIEACRSQPKQAGNKTGFHDVNTFIYQFPTHVYSGFQSIPDYVEMKRNGGTTDLKSPFDVAQLLHQTSNKALQIIAAINPKENMELKNTLHDIETISLMGKYYAEKISGSANMALFRDTNEKQFQKQAIIHLTDALVYWKKFSAHALKQNINPVWLNRVGYIDWQQTTQWVKYDIEIARKNIQNETIKDGYKSPKNH